MELTSANGNTNVYTFKAADNISGGWLVTLPNEDTKYFRIDCKTGNVIKDPLDGFFYEHENVLKSFSKVLQDRKGNIEKFTITENEGTYVVDDMQETVTLEDSPVTSQDVPLNLNEVREPVQEECVVKELGKIGELKFEKGISNALNTNSLKMPYDTFGAKVRNFFADLAMKIAAFFHGEVQFEENNSTANKAEAAIKGLEFTINNDNSSSVKVIDTPRDGNCMLWSTLVSKYGAEKVESSFSEVRNIIIPGLREQIANKCQNDRNTEITKNVGLGAANIKPQEMAAISKFLNTDIAIITQQGGQSVAYLCTREGECKSNQDKEYDQGRFIKALNTGPAIYATNGHARALKVEVLDERNNLNNSTDNNTNSANIQSNDVADLVIELD